VNVDYEIWDVFSNRIFTGNPLAVVTNAEGLTTEQMQNIAREFNLSETSFIISADKADFRARYFTPKREVPMAGHPTIGTVFSLWNSGKIAADEIGLELKAGIFPIKLEYNASGLQKVWMNQGFPKILNPLVDKKQTAKALGLDVDDIVADLPLQVVSAGLEFLLVPLNSLAALARARLNQHLLPSVLPNNHRAVFAFSIESIADKTIRSRMFAEVLGIAEDPATGSAHGPLGLYLAEHNLLRFENDIAEFVSHQGVEMARPGKICVRVKKQQEKYQIEIAGQAVLLGKGQLYL